MSAAMSSVGTKLGLMTPDSTTSLSQYHLRSRCFILPWCSGFLDTEMADWLSMSKVGVEVGEYPSSPINCLIHNISLEASTAAIYSASVVDRATMVWSLLLQLTAPVPNLTKYPPVDLPLSVLPPWSESE